MLLFCLDQVALIFLSRLVRECLGEWSALTQWDTAQGKTTVLCTCSLPSRRCSMESINSGLKLGAVGQQESNGLAGEQCTSAKTSRQNSVHFLPLMQKSDQKWRAIRPKRGIYWTFFFKTRTGSDLQPESHHTAASAYFFLLSEKSCVPIGGMNYVCQL